MVDQCKECCKYRIFVRVVRSLYVWWRVPYMPVHCMCQLSVSELLLSAALSMVCKTINNRPCRVLTHFTRGSQQSWSHVHIREAHPSCCAICDTSPSPAPKYRCPIVILIQNGFARLKWETDRQTDGFCQLCLFVCLSVCLKFEVNINKLPYGRSIYRVFDRPYGVLISWVCISLWALRQVLGAYWTYTLRHNCVLMYSVQRF